MWSLLVGAVFFLLYLATGTRDLSIAHDAASYLVAASAGRDELHPNHLLYAPLAAFVVDVLGELNIPAHRSLTGLDAVAGGMSVALSHGILSKRFGLGARNAAIAVLPIGLSFGVWFYSASIEIYMPALVPLLASLYLLTGPMASRREWIAAGALHAAATLMHQSHILFALAPIVRVIMVRENHRRRLAFIALYSSTAFVLVGSAYWVGAVQADGDGSMNQLLRWVRGYASPDASYWQLTPRAPILALIGLARAQVGGLFGFAIPEASAGLAGAVGFEPYDGPFLVRNLSPSTGWTLAGLAVLVGVLVSWCLVIAIRSSRGLTRERQLVGYLLLLAAAPYCTFFLVWQPHNPEFWIVQTVLLWVVIGGCLLGPRSTNSCSASRGPLLLLGAIAFAMGAINLTSAVRPAMSSSNDYFAAVFQSCPELGRADLLIVENQFPWVSYGELSGRAEQVIAAQPNRPLAISSANGALERGEHVLILAQRGDGARILAEEIAPSYRRQFCSEPNWIGIEPTVAVPR